LARNHRETHYARSGEISIAFQVYGDGPVDIVLVPGMVSHLELAWEHLGYRGFMDRLASFARVIAYDKRGTGLSDPVETAPAFDPRLDDLAAVIQAARGRNPVVFGWSEGATIAALFAATHPDQVQRLILFGAYARMLSGAEDYPFGVDLATVDQFGQMLRDGWGEGVSLVILAPQRMDDEHFRKWWGRFERMSASPGLAASVTSLNSRLDIRDVLPAIHLSTLVLHRSGDPIPIGGGRYIGERILGAQFVELPGTDHWPWLDGGDDVLEHVEEFLTRKAFNPAAGPSARDPNVLRHRRIHHPCGRTRRRRVAEGLGASRRCSAGSC
jgi:pimeloyl-ACP methyl ester carboxylesterase